MVFSLKRSGSAYWLPQRAENVSVALCWVPIQPGGKSEQFVSGSHSAFFPPERNKLRPTQV